MVVPTIEATTIRRRGIPPTRSLSAMSVLIAPPASVRQTSCQWRGESEGSYAEMILAAEPPDDQGKPTISPTRFSAVEGFSQGISQSSRRGRDRGYTRRRIIG